MIVMTWLAAAIAVYMAVAILADRSGWETIARAAMRGFAALSLLYLAMIAVLGGAT